VKDIRLQNSEGSNIIVKGLWEDFY
jgi:hypothetical protein